MHGTNSSGISQMIMLQGGCGRITLQLGNIETIRYVFFKNYILKSNLSLTHIKYICIM
jgi:hypothetical protein